MSANKNFSSSTSKGFTLLPFPHKKPWPTSRQRQWPGRMCSMDCNAWPGTGAAQRSQASGCLARYILGLDILVSLQVISHTWGSWKPFCCNVSMNHEKTHNVKLLSPPALYILLLWAGVPGSRYSSLPSAVSLSLPYHMTGPGRDTKRLTLLAMYCLEKMPCPLRRVPHLHLLLPFICVYSLLSGTANWKHGLRALSRALAFFYSFLFNLRHTEW